MWSWKLKKRKVVCGAEVIEKGVGDHFRGVTEGG